MPDAWGNIAVTPQIIGSDFPNITSGVVTVSLNIVYLYAFELLSPTVIVGARWCVGATPTGAANMGIYTAVGSLVPGSDTGPHTDVAATTITHTYAPSISLLPGQYFSAFSCSAADAIQGVGPFNTSASRAKRATNAMAAGVLPATLGAIVANTSAAPGMALLVSGGLA